MPCKSCAARREWMAKKMAIAYARGAAVIAKAKAKLEKKGE